MALATFLLKILDPGFFVRDRPDRASPRATKKAGDFPAPATGPRGSDSAPRRLKHSGMPDRRMTTRSQSSRVTVPPRPGRYLNSSANGEIVLTRAVHDQG